MKLFIFLISLILTCSSAEARERVDDSRSVVEQPVITMDWKSLIPSGKDRFIMQGYTRVRVVLDVAKWKGTSVRIALRITNPIPGGVTAQWQSRGVLRNGFVQNGNEAVVFEGVVKGETIEDVIDLFIFTDGRTSPDRHAFNFVFETF
jgi:hypothetical protein